MHLGGDWIVPTNAWPVGKVIADRTLFRLTLNPEGDVDFYAGIEDKGLIEPVFSDVTLENNRLLHLGKATYDKKAKWLFDSLRRYRIKYEELYN